MRALALAVATLAVLAAPASAADWGVSAIDFEFVPPEQTIAVGDTVTWTFVTGGHTTTGVSGQAEAWDSGRDGANAAGTTFTKRFDTPGRYQYICTPHQVDMKGVIQVGEDEVARSLARVRTKRTGRRVTVSFTLKEPAKVSYVVRGAARKRVERRRMAPGRRTSRCAASGPAATAACSRQRTTSTRRAPHAARSPFADGAISST